VPWVYPEPAVPYAPSLEAILIYLPSFFGLYSLQALIPPYFGEITIPESEREDMIRKSSEITTVLVGVLYLIMGLTGPLIFNAPNQPAVY